MERRKFTPENVTELSDNEIFVFGSNMKGDHAGGAAQLAFQKFGATRGVGEGLSGKSYAIPTLTREMTKMQLSAIGTSIVRLCVEAAGNPDKDYLVTKIGCGIAGFTEKVIISLFRNAEQVMGKKLDNIILPEGWES